MSIQVNEIFVVSFTGTKERLSVRPIDRSSGCTMGVEEVTAATGCHERNLLFWLGMETNTLRIGGLFGVEQRDCLKALFFKST